MYTLSNLPIIKGLTALYADDLSVISKDVIRTRFDHIYTESDFYKVRQTGRFNWVKNLAAEITLRDDYLAFITNNWCIIRVLELEIPAEQFQIYDSETGLIGPTQYKLDLFRFRDFQEEVYKFSLDHPRRGKM